MKEKSKLRTDSSEGKLGYRVADASGILVPSRLQILEYLSEINRPVSFSSICKNFEITGDQGETALSGRMERLQRSGYVLNDRKGRFGLPQKMDIVVGRILGHSKGFGFVIPDQGGDDLYLHHNQMRKVLHGDRVLAKTKGIDNRGRKEGVIVEVLIQEQREIIGHFHRQGGLGFVEPDDKRFARDISIPLESMGEAREGDIVVCRIMKHPVEHKHAVGEIFEVVGRELAPGMETEIALRKHEIPHSWPKEVDKQINSMARVLQKAEPDAKRRDLRDIPLVTIDGSDARDFDDAVYCERVGKGWRLIVAIADVSHYVVPGSALDNEAYKRGNSVYFPNRVIPMLPEVLSNGICSLKPEEDRYCMVCDMQVTDNGEVAGFEFYAGLMHSKARLTYELVHDIVVNKDADQRKAWSGVTAHLDDLYALSLILRKQRGIRGAIDFEFPEAFIEFDNQKRISNISARQRNEAHRLIEECMLAANVCAAEFLQTHFGGNAIYRNHEGPDPESLTELRKFLSGLGLKLEGGDKPEAKHYSTLVASVAEQNDIAGIVQSVLLRSLSQAVYSSEQLGHFALAYPIYSHFTSPIRRYCDLVVHRQINQVISKKKHKIDSGPGMQLIGEHCSFTGRRADDATYDVIGWLKAEFMLQRVGEEFDGVISGVKEFGVFVQLNDIFVDGLIHVTGLGNDYYHFDPMRYQLKGERTGKRFRLGDTIRVRVGRVDLEEAKIDFDLVDGEVAKGEKRWEKQKDNKGQSKPKQSSKSEKKQSKTKPSRGKGKGKKTNKHERKGGKTKSKSRGSRK